MSLDFLAATTLERVADSTFVAQVPDGWQQGRGAFGGLVLAMLLRAMEAAEPDGARTTRTLSGDLCGPVLPGAAQIAVRVLRRGSNQTNLTAELRQGADVLATASAVLSRPRPHATAPFVPDSLAPADWRTVPLLAIRAPLGPTFATHYEYRSDGPAQFAGVGRAEGWIREQPRLARLDAPALIARLDAWYPTLYHLEGAPRPIATISFVAELLIDPAELPPDEPLQYRARMAALHDGFFVELRELWHAGRVVALNQQTFAVLK